jgi:hypothetical protein
LNGEDMEDLESKRKRENKDLIERMKRGENLSRIPPEATWYPPRPLIKKDLTRLYPEIKDSKKTKLHAITED